MFICNISLVIFFSFSVLCRLVLWACLGSPLPPRPSPSLLLSRWPPSSTLLALVSHAFGLPPPGVKSNYERFMTAGQLHSMSINLATLNCVRCVFFFLFPFSLGIFFCTRRLGTGNSWGVVWGWVSRWRRRTFIFNIVEDLLNLKHFIDHLLLCQLYASLKCINQRILFNLFSSVRRFLGYKCMVKMRLEWHEGLQFWTWKMEVSFGLCGAVPTILGKFSELEDRELWLHANSLNVDLPPLPLFIFHFMCCLSWTPKETARGGVKERGAPRNSIAGHVWWPICVANSLAFPPGFWLPPWLGSWISFMRLFVYVFNKIYYTRTWRTWCHLPSPPTFSLIFV